MTTHSTPLRFFHQLLAVPLLLAGSLALAQPFEPGSSGGNGPPGGFDSPGGEPDIPNGPPSFAGPPPFAGGDDDDGEDGAGDDDDGEENGGVPDFCSGGPQPGGPNGQAGLSSIAHLDFSQQDPDTGDPIEDGAEARIMYRWMAPLFDFVFNAHGLEPEGEHTLTYQPQPLPSTGVICLASGVVNEEGDLHLQDAFDIDTDLPASYDDNPDEAILALVDAADVDCETGEMNAWLPENYLFGDEGMFYVDSDLEEDDGGEDDDEDGEDEDG